MAGFVNLLHQVYWLLSASCQAIWEYQATQSW